MPDRIFADPRLVAIDAEFVASTVTLRFRGRDEIETSLAEAGFDVVDVRDAPDRPAREFVFVARLPSD